MFCFTENRAPRSRQVPWRLAQRRGVFCCGVAVIIFSLWHLWGGLQSAGGLWQGEGRDALVGQQEGATIHHPFIHIILPLPTKDKSSAGFWVGPAKQSELWWHRLPNPFPWLQQQAAASPVGVKRGESPPQGLKPGSCCSRTRALPEGRLKLCLWAALEKQTHGGGEKVAASFPNPRALFFFFFAGAL